MSERRCYGRGPGILAGATSLLVAPFVWASAVAEQSQPSDWLSQFIHQHGLGVGLLAVFVGGFALNFTPCVYPMIPVTLAYFSHQAFGAFRRTVGLACCYVLGISLNYAILGLLAVKTGALFGSWLQQPAVLVVVAGVVIALALSMFGLYELRVPEALMQRLGTASAGFGGAFLMGLVVGLVAAPCIGPFVLGLLLVVSRLQHAALGFLLFFVLGLGMGLPYVVLAIAAHRIGQLPKAGGWLIWSKKALGVVLLGLALYYIKPLLPARALVWAVTALLIGAGVYLGWIEGSASRGATFTWCRRLLGGVLIVSALGLAWPRAQTGPGVVWAPYSEAAFEQARHGGKPILVDVYADWCIPCVEMDQTTFRNPEVVRALAAATLLRLDVTREVSPEGDRLLEHYEIVGAPTILLFDRAGAERTDVRVEGFTDPAEFLRKFQQLVK